MPQASSLAVGSEGRFAPPIKAAARLTGVGLSRQPKRIYRTRRRDAYTPANAIYVGRPTLWSNPFAGRAKIGHARSVILYRAWIAGNLDIYSLGRAGFSPAEIEALRRWRDRLIAALPRLAGHDLQCWCPPTSAWCHADVLLDLARRPQ